METRKLEDLDVEGVIAFLTTIRLDKVLGDEFKEQQIDGELLLDGKGSCRQYVCIFSYL